MSSIDMLVNLHVLGKYDTPDYVETLVGSRHNENLFGIGGPDVIYGMGVKTFFTENTGLIPFTVAMAPTNSLAKKITMFYMAVPHLIN